MKKNRKKSLSIKILAKNLFLHFQVQLSTQISSLSKLSGLSLGIQTSCDDETELSETF